MNKLIIVSVSAFLFTTGFTCSKNAPQQAAPTAEQAQMAAPPTAETPASAPTSTDTTAPAVATPTETK